MYRKNTASQYIGFQLNSSTTGAGVASASVTVNICIDGAGSYSSGGGTVTSLGGGGYVYAMAQADTNGNDITIQFSATGCITVEKTFLTTACNPSVATNFGITSLPTTAIDTNGSLVTVGTGTGQITLSSGDVTFANTSIATVTTVTNQLTAAAIATGVWQDATAGDFTTSGSIGKSLFTSGNAPGAASGLALVGSNMGTASSVTGAVGSVTGNVGGSVASVTGAVGSVTGNVGGSVASVTGNVSGNVVGSVASVTAAVTVTMSQVLSSPRALDSISDGSIQLNDALWAAIGAGVGIKDASSGTSLVISTPHTATVLRTYTITTTTIPTTVPDKIA